MKNKVRKPSVKQQKAFKLLVENSSRSMKEVMIRAGYSAKTAIAPTKLTNTLSWQELMNKHFPDHVLSKKVEEGLNAKQGKKPDYNVQHKYLTTALQLKGKLIDRKDITSMGKELPRPIYGGLSVIQEAEVIEEKK